MASTGLGLLILAGAVTAMCGAVLSDRSRHAEHIGWALGVLPPLALSSVWAAVSLLSSPLMATLGVLLSVMTVLGGVWAASRARSRPLWVSPVIILAAVALAGTTMHLMVPEDGWSPWATVMVYACLSSLIWEANDWPEPPPTTTHQEG